MGVVLFVVDEIDESMRVALARAQALASTADAALHVIRVISPPAPWHASSLTELFDAERELRRELRAVLPEALGSDRLRVCCGELTREVSAAVSRERAQLVVVLAASPSASRAAGVIARQTRVPVLVARAHRPSGAVLGTTDLEHRRYPELRRAFQLVGWLSAPLVVLHSLPAARAGLADTDAELAVAEDVYAVTSCCELLKQVTAELAPGAELVVARSDDPLDAILEQERRRACDLLVIGARIAGGPGGEPSLAETVVSRASSSVLVMPLE